MHGFVYTDSLPRGILLGKTIGRQRCRGGVRTHSGKPFPSLILHAGEWLESVALAGGQPHAGSGTYYLRLKMARGERLLPSVGNEAERTIVC